MLFVMPLQLEDPEEASQHCMRRVRHILASQAHCSGAQDVVQGKERLVWHGRRPRHGLAQR